MCAGVFDFGYDGSAMKWSVKLITKRKRKQPVRLKANSIDEMAEKLSKRSTKFLDFEIETPVNDPEYWKNLILSKLFQKTRNSDTTPTLF